MSLSEEFGLPLSLMVVRAKGGLDPGTTRRLLGVLRTAEPTALLTLSELAVMLPNTGPGSARAVESRARKVFLDAGVGIVSREPGDTVLDLIGRARSAAGEES